MKKLRLILFISLFIFSCQNDEITRAKLNYFSKLFTVSKDNVVEIVSNSEFNNIIGYLEHDISVYTITYNTTYQGKQIIASGMVAFPDTEEGMPMLNFNHGTTSLHSDAPTVDLLQYSFFSNAASAGYILVIPDYLGFGSSEDIVHPYYRSDITGQTVVDMLIATKELANLEGYNYNGDVFLSGYSEGGFATMAAHYNIENNNYSNINLVASAPAAGGYDITGMLNYFLSLETYHVPYYIAYVAIGYKTSYNWDISLNTIFNEPYASNIPEYFNGKFSGSQINNVLNDTISSLFNEKFLNETYSNNDFSIFVDALEDNSLDNWTPRNKMFMYHGSSDITVPYQNSVDTYNRFLSKVSDKSIIEFITLDGKDHSSGSLPYILDIFEKFNALK
jgi:pimeloyl-ACP methyl ester carboxylesterase